MTLTAKEFLNNVRISKPEFDDFQIVQDELIKKNSSDSEAEIVFKWFSFLHSIEIAGWRTKESTKKITRLLVGGLRGEPVTYFALFCPSYKKGDGAYGFRTDDVGDTSKSGVKLISMIQNKTKELNIKLEKPRAIFFDIAVEQPEKVLSNNSIKDLATNIENLKKYIPTNTSFTKLSDLAPEVMSKIGYEGIVIDPLPIPSQIFERIVERGGKFYELFGWNKDQIIHRSKIIASSEAFVGNLLRNKIPNGIMIYTPTMLERAAVYSGDKYYSDPLPIIFPKKLGL